MTKNLKSKEFKKPINIAENLDYLVIDPKKALLKMLCDKFISKIKNLINCLDKKLNPKKHETKLNDEQHKNNVERLNEAFVKKRPDLLVNTLKDLLRTKLAKKKITNANGDTKIEIISQCGEFPESIYRGKHNLASVHFEESGNLVLTLTNFKGVYPFPDKFILKKENNNSFSYSTPNPNYDHNKEKSSNPENSKFIKITVKAEDINYFFEK